MDHDYIEVLSSVIFTLHFLTFTWPAPTELTAIQEVKQGQAILLPTCTNQKGT